MTEAQPADSPAETLADSPKALLAATALGTAGVIVFALLPILAGQIAAQHALTDTQTGITSSAYFSLYALIALTAPLWIRRVDWRRMALTGFIALLLGLGTLALSDTLKMVYVAMAIAGAGSALLLPISIALVSDMQNKERAYGITIALQQLVPTLLLLALSAAWTAAYTLSNTLLAVGVTVALSAMLSFGLPRQGRHPTLPNPSHTATGSSKRTLLGLVGLALSFAGFAAMWVFIERLAVSSGLDHEFTAFWIAVGLLMTAAGSLGSALLSDRIGRVAPLVVPMLLAILCVYLLSGTITRTLYALTLIGFPFGYYVSLSYVLSVIVDSDPQGKLASLVSFALALGALVGPAVFGVLRESNSSLELVFVATVLTAGTCLVLYVHAQQSRLSDSSSNPGHKKENSDG